MAVVLGWATWVFLRGSINSLPHIGQAPLITPKRLEKGQRADSGRVSPGGDHNQQIVAFHGVTARAQQSAKIPV